MQEMATTLAERARITEDPRARAGAVGARRRAAARDAERSGRRGRGVPRGAGGRARRSDRAVGAGGDRGAPRGLVDAARGADAALRRDVRRRSDRRAAEAGAQRRAEAVRRRPGDRVPAPDHRRRRDATRSRTWSWSGCCARTRAGTTWSRCSACTRTPRAKAGRKPAELALRVAIADVWEKELDSPDSAAEALEKVLQVAPDERGGAAVAGAPARGRGALGRGGRGAGEGGGERVGARGDRRDPVPQRADPDQQGGGRRRRSSGRCCARWTPTRPTAPTLAALEKMARDAKDDERLVQLLELGAGDRGRRRRSAGACCSEVAALYAGPLGHPAAALPHLERLVLLDPKEIPGREQLADALVGVGPHRRRGAHHGASWSRS